jgi:hypothetical protein
MPNRILKESITTSCEVDNLSAEEERFFYRLIVICDDFGRMDARPPVLRARCYPLKLDSIKDKDIEKWLKALVEQKLIFIYKVNGKPFLQMTTWDKHQQKRAKKSKFPAPDEGMISNDINRYQMQSYVPENREYENREYENREYGTEEKEPPAPYEKIKALYNNICKSLPKAQVMSETRKTHIKARWRQYDFNMARFEELFKKAEESDFLKGKNDKNWKADFDWLINEANMTKTLEGKYDNKGGRLDNGPPKDPAGKYRKFVS